VKKYSNFVGFDILLDDEPINVVRAIWALPKDKISADEHREFYQFIAHAFDEPIYRLHYSTDSPITLNSLFYFPPTHFEKKCTWENGSWCICLFEKSTYST